jgi:hypothetical protein
MEVFNFIANSIHAKYESMEEKGGKFNKSAKSASDRSFEMKTLSRDMSHRGFSLVSRNTNNEGKSVVYNLNLESEERKCKC